MKRYEIVATELGSCLGISVGTAYSLESREVVLTILSFIMSYICLENKNLPIITTFICLKD